MSTTASSARREEIREEICKLSKLHRKAVGETFTAKYKGTKVLHSKKWDVFAVKSNEPLCDKLEEFYSKANDKAWKGFTSPDDSPRYVDYWIFGELDDNDRRWVEVKEERTVKEHTFKIEKSTRFESDEWKKKEYSLKVGFFYEISLKYESSDSEDD